VLNLAEYLKKEEIAQSSGIPFWLRYFLLSSVLFSSLGLSSSALFSSLWLSSTALFSS
jgi:hypothetical protein